MRALFLVLFYFVILTVPLGCCKKPSYTPAYWNNDHLIQSNNNCYNYGNNKRTDTYAQPGRISGINDYNILCAPVTHAAIADGIEPAPNSLECPFGKDLVALYVDPDIDYHWYRKDANGFWSHKPGPNPATNLDNIGDPITNPETANRCGDYVCYHEFCGYFCVCSCDREGHGHEKIQ